MGSPNAQKFQTIIADVLGISPEQVTDDLTPDRVDAWDSLNHINIVGALEQEFGVAFATDDLAGTQSVRKLKDLLVRHGVQL